MLAISGTTGVGGIDGNVIVNFGVETNGAYLGCGAGSFMHYGRADFSTIDIEHVTVIVG